MELRVHHATHRAAVAARDGFPAGCLALAGEWLDVLAARHTHGTHPRPLSAMYCATAVRCLTDSRRSSYRMSSPPSASK